MFLFLFPAPASPRRRGGGRARDWLSARVHRNAAAAAGAEGRGPGPGRCGGSRRPRSPTEETARDWRRAGRWRAGSFRGGHRAPGTGFGWTGDFVF